jgi:hypothetical protein
VRAASVQSLIDRLRLRKRNYTSLFSPGAPGHDALADLARFCRAYGDDVVIGDHDRTLVLAGRREAFWRIVDHLNLQPEELVHVYRAVRLGEAA